MAIDRDMRNLEAFGMTKKNVLEWLEHTAELYPNKIAFQDSNNDLAFLDVMNKAKAIGTVVSKIKKKAPIAVFVTRNVMSIISYFGVVYGGHAYAPIDSALPEARISSILNTLRPAAVIINKDDADRVYPVIAESGIDTVLVFEEIVESTTNDDELLLVREKMISTDPLYVLFTSGSTGVPKGVITSHLSLMLYIESYTKVMKINDNDILGNQSPLDYIAAIRDIYIPLLTGCSSIIIPKEYFIQPERLFDFMNSKHISAVGWSVSAFTLLSKLNCFENEGLLTLNKISFSGSEMPGICLSEWQKRLPDATFVNQYGPTEATASCTYYVVDHLVDSDERIPIGKPYDNYRILLLDKNLNSVADGEIGEICITGPILALGYYNDQNRTNEAFVAKTVENGYSERIYRTGDLGRMRKDGLLEFHGRMDRQVKHMGHRVELDEVEIAVSGIEGVSKNVVLYDAKREHLVLYYTGSATKKSIALELRKTLPDFMVPRKIVNLGSIPLLPNGKIDMKVMEELLNEGCNLRNTI